MILESYQTHISKPIVSIDKLEYKRGEKIIVSRWVNYNDEATSDVLLRIFASNPSENTIFNGYVTNNADGTFAIEIPIEKNEKLEIMKLK